MHLHFFSSPPFAPRMFRFPVCVFRRFYSYFAQNQVPPASECDQRGRLRRRRDEKRSLPVKCIYRSIFGRAGDILADESIHSRIYPFMDQFIAGPSVPKAWKCSRRVKPFIERFRSVGVRLTSPRRQQSYPVTSNSRAAPRRAARRKKS